MDVLRDVCLRITGQTTFTYDYVDKDYEDEFLAPTYNKGRMAILKYQNQAIYISFPSKKLVVGIQVFRVCQLLLIYTLQSLSI